MVIVSYSTYKPLHAVVLLIQATKMISLGSSSSRCAVSRTRASRSNHQSACKALRYFASPPPRHAAAASGIVRGRMALGATLASQRANAAVVEQLVDEMRLLETERDDAIKTGESCARNVVKLEEMVELLDRLATERVRAGDDAAARAALAEKAEARDALEKASARAAANYALAAKLAEKVGEAQRQLMAAMGSSGSTSSPAGSAPADAPAAGTSEGRLPDGTSGTPSSSSSSPAVTAAAAEPLSTFASNPSPPPPPPPRRMPWEDSLEAARARIREADAAAAAAAADARLSGARAAASARETLEEARARLRAEAAASVAAARARVSASAGESIAEARARIAREDELALGKVRALMARYRRGEYVAEAELEWAFRELERRFPR